MLVSISMVTITVLIVITDASILLIIVGRLVPVCGLKVCASDAEAEQEPYERDASESAKSKCFSPGPELR